ncbi:dihydroorotase [Croceibacter atlanticus]|uniref:dihydroorotase n=1 Tax=Croceibacter atlanticus TaxID=313588 RepID=UPI0030DA5C7D
MTILIKSAKIIDPKSAFHNKQVDILVENGTIKTIAETITTSADTVVKLENLHLSQGWFDSSVSFGEPGYEERETIANGLNVAGKSGFTDIVLNPKTNPIVDTSSLVVAITNKAQLHAVALHICGALTKHSKGVDLAELYDMHKHGAITFGDYKHAITNANLLKIALLYAQNFNGLVQSYPQDNQIAGKGLVNEHHNSTLYGLKGIPSLAEELQITRDLFILEYTGGKLHIPTITTAKSVELIKDAKAKGLDITCSVSVNHLLLTDDKLEEFESNYKLQPPLRTATDVNALRKGLTDGTIDMVTCDHQPIDIEHKKTEFENASYGSIGLETAFGALKTIFTTEEIVNFLTRGKQRFNIKTSEIKEGNKANFSLFNPEGSSTFTEKNVLSTSKNSALLGTTLKGTVYGIVSQGDILLN